MISHKATARVAHEDSPLFGLDGAYPKTIYVNISGVGVRLNGAKSRFSGSEQVFYTRAHDNNEDLPGYGFSVTVFTPDSVGHLRNRATLSVTTIGGKHLNRRYAINATQMRVNSFESFVGDKLEELIAELEQDDQSARTNAMAVIRHALTTAGYNLNVHQIALSGKYKLSCAFQVPANGQVYVAQLDVVNPYVNRGYGGHCMSISKANGTTIVVFGEQTKDFPEERKLKFYMERLLGAFRSKLGLGLPPALAAIALAIGRAHHEHQSAPLISTYDRRDIPEHVQAHNSANYKFELVRCDKIELRYNLQLGAKTVTMSVSDEDQAFGHGYTVLLLPGAFDNFDTQRVKVKILDLDAVNLRKAAEATLDLWQDLFNEGLPPHHHVRIHGRVSHEQKTTKFAELEELPKTIKLEELDLMFDNEEKITSVGGATHRVQWCYYNSADKTVSVELTIERPLKSFLSLRIYHNDDKSIVPTRHGYVIGHVVIHPDSSGCYDLKDVIKKLDEYLPEKHPRVEARVATETGICDWTDLPEKFTIGRTTFKRVVFTIEKGRGVKARWYDVKGSGAYFAWRYNELELRLLKWTRVPDFRINVKRTPLTSVDQLNDLITQKLQGRI